ncbi:MAG: P-II family nitrogen regulator [Nitrospira sp.]|nr:P-II family nitrogen regulator [Nitrospira sp.]
MSRFIVKNAYTDEIGDGKIFIYDLIDVIRIRTEKNCGVKIWYPADFTS